jgi:pimeloyl-ACP methyl ester carboxylesterase
MATTEGYLTTDDGVRLYFQTLGNGSKVLIIPNAAWTYTDFSVLEPGRTLIFYDLRNRGRSDPVSDKARLSRGILRDVDDLAAVRRHFGIDRCDVIGWSYLGMMVVLYAEQHPHDVGRVVQIGPVQPDLTKEYPPHLANRDGVLEQVLAEFREAGSLSDAQEASRRVQAALRRMLVADPKRACKLDHWDLAHLPNERGGIRHWQENIEPSIRALGLTPERLARIDTPVLTIHGTKDRNAPYGAGREWALALPNARLLTIEGAAHAPFIEAPQAVFGAIETFLGGDWPVAAEKVTVLDPPRP